MVIPAHMRGAACKVPVNRKRTTRSPARTCSKLMLSGSLAAARESTMQYSAKPPFRVTPTILQMSVSLSKVVLQAIDSTLPDWCSRSGRQSSCSRGIFRRCPSWSLRLFCRRACALRPFLRPVPWLRSFPLVREIPYAVSSALSPERISSLRTVMGTLQPMLSNSPFATIASERVEEHEKGQAQRGGNTADRYGSSLQRLS